MAHQRSTDTVDRHIYLLSLCTEQLIQTCTVWTARGAQPVIITTLFGVSFGVCTDDMHKNTAGASTFDEASCVMWWFLKYLYGCLHIESLRVSVIIQRTDLSGTNRQTDLWLLCDSLSDALSWLRLQYFLSFGHAVMFFFSNFHRTSTVLLLWILIFLYCFTNKPPERVWSSIICKTSVQVESQHLLFFIFPT